MEPTFVATPYVQVRSPLSGQIRTWLDEQEAGYTQWRASRKPVSHSFASAKLNSPLRAVPRSITSASGSTPLWMTRSNHASEAGEATRKKLETTLKERNGAASMGIGTTASDLRVGTTDTSGTLDTRRSSLSTSALPMLSKREELRRQSLARKSGRLADLPLAGKPEPRVRTSAVAKQRLEEHRYAFHSRHVFSFARRPDEENPAEQQMKHESGSSATSEASSKRSNDSIIDTGVDDPLLQSSSDTDSTLPAPATTFARNSRSPDDCVLEGLAFTTREDYDRIFDHDWRLSDVERVVRDAVERKRIHHTLKLSYRMLLWFFRFYAGKTGLASSNTSATNAQTLFQVADKLKLLEDLNVQCVDPGKFGVTNTPLTRDGLVGFVLSVARMMSVHSQSSARSRVLTAEGVEVSDATKTLVRDYVGAYAQLQDADHFRNVFLRFQLSGSSTRQPRRLQEVLREHTETLRDFFSETARGATTLVRQETTTASQDTTRQCVSFSQFLSALRALRVVASVKGASSDRTPTGSHEPTANAPPAVVEESRVLRAFLSCLAVSEVEGVDTRDTATFEQFVEALLRVALLRRELTICCGDFDVCPKELVSDVCSCDCESARYDFGAFDAAAEELFRGIQALCLARVRTRAALTMQPLRSGNCDNCDTNCDSNDHSVATSKLSIVQKTGTRLALFPTDQGK